MVKLEYKCGPLNVNLRVLLEPKGFLRIIVLLIAVLAFALTAGFQGSANTVTCTSSITGNPNYTASLTFSYPFSVYSLVIETHDNFTRNNSVCSLPIFTNAAFSSSAQFFVALGVLTMLYVLGAILVYMLFITPELFMAKWIVIGDLFGTILFAILYTIASLAWSIGAAQLHDFLRLQLTNIATNCFICTGPLLITLQPFTQPAISAIFGWLASFVWFSSVWFVYKDTVWHKDETGPLASLYKRQADKKASREEQGEQSESHTGEQSEAQQTEEGE